MLGEHTHTTVVPPLLTKIKEPFCDSYLSQPKSICEWRDTVLDVWTGDSLWHSIFLSEQPSPVKAIIQPNTSTSVMWEQVCHNKQCILKSVYVCSFGRIMMMLFSLRVCMVATIKEVTHVFLYLTSLTYFPFFLFSFFVGQKKNICMYVCMYVLLYLIYKVHRHAQICELKPLYPKRKFLCETHLRK